MLLERWAVAWELYNESGFRRLIRALYSPRKILVYLWLWVITVLYIISSVFLAFGHGNAQVVAFFVSLLAFWLYYIVVEKTLARAFQREYEKHGISKHPFSIRRLYLRYALFLDALAKSELSQQELAELAKFADIAGKPNPVFKISQHPAVVPVMAVLTVLVTELIKGSVPWRTGNGEVFIFTLGVGLLFLVMALDAIHSSKQKHAELSRFLCWARHDIDEEKRYRDEVKC